MTALYIHIPFCVKKCGYCDFVSFAGVDEETVDMYVSALLKELKARENFLRGGISTVYMGGGTPVLLSPRHVGSIFSAIKKICPDFPGEREITIEANPGAVDADKLKAFRETGISRVSLGVQSFDDGLLGILGRIHKANDSVRTYNDCRSAGFENISFDLMFALPNQTLSLWGKDIRKAVSLAPEHISCYNLQVEEGTPMWEKKYSEDGEPVGERLIFPGEEMDAEMYLFAAEYLKEHDYRRYEISNF
ncbi:MAG: radical SAM family heme chaperone HemW, partial [Candidatus Omnitrophica bacterium]|nr:radical SAM family heme chaperone HemW [Candidatus Omnitrophota bacterium]